MENKIKAEMPEKKPIEAKKPSIMEELEETFGVTDSMEKEITDSIVNEIPTSKEEILNLIQNGFQEVIQEVGKKIIEFGKKKIDETPLSEEMKSNLKVLWEFGMLYVLCVASICVYFGFLNPINWNEIVAIGVVLGGIILVGAVKRILWMIVLSKEKSIKDLEIETSILKTSLSVITIENAKMKELLIKYNPNFRTELIFTTKK